MRLRSRFGGGVISRSFSSLSHRDFTPMLSSTSRSRLTSSIRATRRSVVRPRLRSEAQSSATPAFLEVFTSMEPLSRVGPVTRRWVGPWPMLTMGESRASPMRAIISRDRFWWPRSIRLTALWLVAELVGELLLRPAPVLAGVADQVADSGQVVLSHRATVSQI